MDMLQAPGWWWGGGGGVEGGGQGWRLGTGTLEGGEPSGTASVCAVSPSMLLADHSHSPFLESYRTPQTRWGVLGPGAWLVPRASSFLPRNCLTSPPFGPSGARTASSVCAVPDTSLGEAISFMQGGERLALEASSIAELGVGARSWIPS